MRDRDFDTALDRAKSGKLAVRKAEFVESVKNTANRGKTTAVRVKVGRLAIAAIKGSLKRTPGLPEVVKAYMDNPLADIIIGSVVPVAIPMVTTNKKAIRVSEDVAIATGVMIADELEFIDELVITMLNKVGSLADDGEKDAPKADEPGPF